MTTAGSTENLHELLRWVEERRPAPFYPSWEHSRPAAGIVTSEMQLPGKRMAAARLVLPGGWRSEPEGLAGATWTGFRCALRDGADGSGNFSRELDGLSARASVDVRPESVAIGWLAPVEKLDRVTAMVLEALRAPAVSDNAWRAVTGQNGAELTRAPRDVSVIARHHAQVESESAAQAGVRLREGRTGGGQPSAESVRAWHSKSLAAKNAQLVVAGDGERNRAPDIAAALLTGWSTRRHLLPRTSVRTGARFVAVPGAARTGWCWRGVVPTTSFRAAVLVEAGITALAGWTGSALTEVLVADRGFSYVLACQVEPRLVDEEVIDVEFTISATVASESTAAAWQAIRGVVEEIRASGLPARRLRPALSWLINSQRLVIDTPNQLTDAHCRLLHLGHGADAPRLWAEELAQADIAEVSALLTMSIDFASTAVCMAGDPAARPSGFSEVAS